jgi:genome maintenance exonuclease 1
MYNPKFNYQSLSKVNLDGSRVYNTPDGEKLPSVTTILDATKTEEKKKVLQQWRNRVGHEAAKQISTEAANRGTKMHSYLEWYIRDGILKDKPGNIFHHPSWAMADSVIKQGLANCDEFWGIEVPLYFPKVYAGTTDCVGVHNGIPSILDFKQSNKPKKREWIEDYFLQLAAYSEAHNELHNTRINRGVIMMCVKPEVDNNGIIKSVPEYQEFILESTEFEKYRSMWWRRVEQYYTNS